MNPLDLNDKSVVIIGFGIEGQSTYSFLRQSCPAARLAIADRQMFSRPDLSSDVRAAIEQHPCADLHFGPDYLKGIREYDIAVKSAGIAWSNPAIRAFEAGGGKVTSHMEIFFSIFDRNRTVGITGTKGKSTTATLLHHMARVTDLDVRLAGNIGCPPLSLITGSRQETIFILEMSSYQLDRFNYSPHIAVLLDIVPDHIGLHSPSSESAHHETFEDYRSAKANIARTQEPEDVFIYNPFHRYSREIETVSRARKVHFSADRLVNVGAYISEGGIFYSNGLKHVQVAEVDDIPLIGKFNRDNVLAAVTAGASIGVPLKSMRQSIRSFKPLPHRIEFVAEVAGVRFYDDSISTVPQATLNALDGLGDDVQTLIVGGHDRGLEYEGLVSGLVRSKIKNLVLFQPTGRFIWDALLAISGTKTQIRPFWPESMEQAVRIAFEVTDPNKICLLSPASSSYGMFDNFVQRADQFKASIQALEKELRQTHSETAD